MIVAPQPDDERERLRALREYAILDTADEKVFNDIAELASFICNTPISTITLIDENRQWFKSRVGLDDQETPRDVAFCAHAILDDKMMVVNDAKQDERFHDNPYVTGKPDIRFYAGMPLITPGGYKIGTICVIDTKPRALTEKQYFALQVLREQVMLLLETRKRNEQLAKTQEMNNRLLSIIGHDLRGPVNSIEGLLLLAEKYDLSLEEYKELIPRIRQMVDTTNNLLLNLLHWSKSQIEGKFHRLETINVRALVQHILGTHAPLFQSKKNVIDLNLDEHLQVSGDRNKLEFVFRNLLLNANKYSESGTIGLSSQSGTKTLTFCISDKGSGVEADRVGNLFSWGERNSTDGTRGEKGSGLGLPMCREFIEQMGGKIWCESRLGEGASFFFTISAP